MVDGNIYSSYIHVFSTFVIIITAVTNTAAAEH